jgi:two-component system, OmpR family, sensor kinase
MRHSHPFKGYVKARLHRRIFFLLGGSIFFTGIIFAVTQWTLGGLASQRQVDAARVFVGRRFEHVWDDPVERDTLAREMASDLSLDVRLRDDTHKEIASFGGPCNHPALVTPVLRAGSAIGYADVCIDRMHPRAPLRALWPTLAAVFVLWAASGRLARRLTRPYGELARVARDIGTGKLASRVTLPRRAHGEARVLADAINDMAGRIEKQMNDQRELLAGVSHEIRTPLSRIRLLVELCRAGGHDREPILDAKTLDEIDREVVEIDALVSELLASSRLDFLALSPHTLDAVDIAKRALERQGEAASKLTASKEAIEITADPTLLLRALANLIDNARSHGGGVEALLVRPTEAGVVFEALDRGPGFAPGEETRVFESFYQRPGAEPREKGALGLGLTLVKRIAEAHGGRVFAANRDGGGARVGMELPRSSSVTSTTAA